MRISAYFATFAILSYTKIIDNSWHLSHLLSYFLLGIQWVKSTVPTGKTYDDISFPISFAQEVYQIIPADWDTASITTAKEYAFTVIDNKVTLTGARITANGAAGYYKALIIGK